MATIAQAFQQFVSTLELTEGERAEAKRQHEVVRANLRATLRVREDFLSGSYKRRTAIRPLHDIDVFLVLDESAHGSLRTRGPDACLDLVRSALDKAYRAQVPTKTQGRSVNISFSGTSIGYDIVPAFFVREGIYVIPDRERKSWIQTNPKVHEDACTAANQRAGGMLNALIKATKRWRDVAKAPLRSFHLEVMAYEAFAQPPASYADGLSRLFAFLADRVLQSCAEPARIGPNIDAGIAQADRLAVRNKLLEAASAGGRALGLDAAGRSHDAHAIWRTLLGTDYSR